MIMRRVVPVVTPWSNSNVDVAWRRRMFLIQHFIVEPWRRVVDVVGLERRNFNNLSLWYHVLLLMFVMKILAMEIIIVTWPWWTMILAVMAHLGFVMFILSMSILRIPIMVVGFSMRGVDT
jgi:uncharacterized Tic20 family protein